MTLLEEYRKQYAWHDWKRALSLCPTLPGQQVLDLGCGAWRHLGGVFGARASVLGIDGNVELLAAAQSAVRSVDLRSTISSV